MARPDFTKTWASSRLSIPTISGPDYAKGFLDYLGSQPPTTDDHDYIMNLQDQRAVWLGEQMLLAVGHEWQDDVSYDEYAVVRSPVNGQLYHSLTSGNLGNEPSVSGSDWGPGVAPQDSVPESLATSGVQGSFSNLKLSATGLSASVGITANSICLKNSGNEPVVVNSVSVTPSLSASGANGLDTGTSAASTWYSVWVIWNGTTAAGLLSLSATSPSLPSGYTHKARVGWVRSDGTANKYPLSFVQYGKSVRYKVAAGSNITGLPVMASGAQGNINTPTWVSVSTSNFVPSTAGAIVEAITGVSGVAGTSMVAPNNSYGAFTSSSNPPPHVWSTGVASRSISPFILLLESTNIYFATDIASQLFCLGWEDNL